MITDMLENEDIVGSINRTNESIIKRLRRELAEKEKAHQKELQEKEKTLKEKDALINELKRQLTAKKPE